MNFVLVFHTDFAGIFALFTIILMDAYYSIAIGRSLVIIDCSGRRSRGWGEYQVLSIRFRE
jgi:hypothetical protein